MTLVERLWRWLLALFDSILGKRKGSMGVQSNEDFTDDTLAYREGVFVGRGSTLEEALEDAHRQAKRPLDVERIQVSGTNPINEYRVITRATG